MTTKIPIELSSTPSIVDGGNATAITIDSSENVGIGCTPVATLQVKTQTNGNLAFQNSTSVSGGVKLNCFNDAANASSPFEIDGSTLQFNIGSSEKMRIDSSGKVGIGTTSPDRNLTVFATNPILNIKNSNANLHLEQAGENAYIGNSSTSGFLQFFTNNGNATVHMLANGNVGIGTASPDFNLEVQESSASTYAARVMHTGNPNSGPPQIMRLDFWQTPNNGTSEFLKCRDTASGTAVNRAVIMSNGGIGNYTTNDFNYSDERMKKDISDATAQLDNIKKLQLKTFRYKEQEASEPTNLGVVAQDIQTDFPALVTEQGEGDEARLGVKEQQIMWMAVKAIQEQQAIIEDLQTQINEVKNGN